jgi:hypothetical protein
MRIVVIGDVGVVGGMMHIGDEAMFDALVEALRARGASSIVGVSSDPPETAERYGIEAVPPIGFTGGRADMEARFAAVVRCAAGEQALPADDPVWGVIDAVAGADAAAIAGGGNMASNRPMHVFERAALGVIAEAFGRPLVVTGQTLGPRLDPAERELVGGLLRRARLVGVREHASERLALELGVPRDRLAANRDDATFLGLGIGGGLGGTGTSGDEGRADAAGVTGAAVAPILVSLSLHLGGLPRPQAVAGLAAALDGLAERAGRPIVFHPHFGSLDPSRTAGDEVLHDEVRAAMRAPAEALQPGDPRPAARLARGAAMLVTSRYHPAVFAGPGGVPVAALSADDYTAVKLRGATGWWDQHGVIDLAAAVSPSGADALGGVWDTRAQAQADAARLRPAAEAASAAWFDRVVEALGG